MNTVPQETLIGSTNLDKEGLTLEIMYEMAYNRTH